MPSVRTKAIVRRSAVASQRAISRRPFKPIPTSDDAGASQSVHESITRRPNAKTHLRRREIWSGNRIAYEISQALQALSGVGRGSQAACYCEMQKATDKLKGAHYSSRTHCRRGHEFAVHELSYKNHVNGRQYRYCKLCNKINARQGSKLPDEIVEKVKSLVRSGNPLNLFTSGGKPGYLCRFASVKLLRQEVGAERRLRTCRDRARFSQVQQSGSGRIGYNPVLPKRVADLAQAQACRPRPWYEPCLIRGQDHVLRAERANYLRLVSGSRHGCLQPDTVEHTTTRSIERRQ